MILCGTYRKRLFDHGTINIFEILYISLLVLFHPFYVSELFVQPLEHKVVELILIGQDGLHDGNGNHGHKLTTG